MIHSAQAFDPQWGMLIATLQAEGCTPEEIEQAKDILRDVVKKPDVPVSEKAKALYAKVIPKNRDELVASVQQGALAFTEHKIRELLHKTPEHAEQTQRELLQSGSYIDETFRLLRQLGATNMTGFYYYSIKDHCSHEEGTEKIDAMVNEIFADFVAGIPTSFAVMADLFGKRITGSVPLSHRSISDIAKFNILKRLAELKVEKAQSALSWAYENNTIGSDKQAASLQQNVIERIQGLRTLALAGHAPSQIALAKALIYSSLPNGTAVYLSEETRRTYVQELQEHEVPFNFYITGCIRDNKIAHMPFGLSLEKRLALLHERARKGEEQSFSLLFNAYCNNTLGEDSLALTPKARFSHLKTLKPYNPTLFDEYITYLYEYNCLGPEKDPMLFNLSVDSRMVWLKDQAMHKGNSQAQASLARAYARNSLDLGYTTGSAFLRIPLQERVTKLKQLADRNCWQAQNVLLKHYGYTPDRHAEEILFKSNNPQNDLSKQMQALRLTNPLSQEDLLRWGLLFGQNKGVIEALASTVTDLKIRQAVLFLFSIRNSMK